MNDCQKECKKPDILDFKRMFAKVFKFAPYKEWVPTVYNTGDEVNVDKQTYTSLIDNNAQPVTDEEAWTLSEYKPCAPMWVAPIAYEAGAEVLWLNDTTWIWGVYQSLVSDNYTAPSDTTMWEPVEGVNLRQYVADSDIEEAMREAATVVPDHSPMICEEYQMCFLLMTAHFVITDWQAANAGLNASGTGGILTSRTAGKMSAGYAVSPILQQYPQYQMYLTTPWGLKAMTTILRYNVGNLIGVQGKFTSY